MWIRRCNEAKFIKEACFLENSDTNFLYAQRMIPGLLEPIIGGWNLRVRIIICNFRDMCDTFSRRVMVSGFP
jgi:hypothetical protein